MFREADAASLFGLAPDARALEKKLFLKGQLLLQFDAVSVTLSVEKAVVPTKDDFLTLLVSKKMPQKTCVLCQNSVETSGVAPPDPWDSPWQAN